MNVSGFCRKFANKHKNNTIHNFRFKILIINNVWFLFWLESKHTHKRTHLCRHNFLLFAFARYFNNDIDLFSFVCNICNALVVLSCFRSSEFLFIRWICNGNSGIFVAKTNNVTTLTTEKYIQRMYTQAKAAPNGSASSVKEHHRELLLYSFYSF